MKIKARAFRHRVWFKVLSRAERAIIDLTVKCVERVRSPVLAAIVSSIVGKVLKILKSGFLEKVNRVGSAIAEKVCGVAEGWGNENASSWKHDSGFIRFLGVNAIATLGV
jgi:hypothetical protein